MRDTKYARELCEPGVKKWPSGSEGRIERLLIKKSRTEEIRFSWWKDGRLATRPLDLSEEDLVTLFEDAIAKDVFTTEFKSRLKGLLQNHQGSSVCRRGAGTHACCAETRLGASP